MIDDEVFVRVCKRTYRAPQHGDVGVLMIHGKQANEEGWKSYRFQAQDEDRQSR